jgi:nitronate monooxygenase
MAGGGDTPELVAAVCEAGAFGFIGAAYLSPEQIRTAGVRVRELTTRPFGVNLFAPTPAPHESGDIASAVEALRRYHKELGLAAPSLPPPPHYHFDAQLEAALGSGATAFSFTFGELPASAVQAIKTEAMFLMGTATTVSEAQLLEKSGVDAVIAQGSEAGGHRGTFALGFEGGMVGTIALVPQIVDSVQIPVIASGGIMDGRGIAAALALGASAVQMGTAFLTCHEAGVSAVYKQAILEAREDQTRITRAFSGRPARGVVNRFMLEMDDATGAPAAVLPFPLQNRLTRPLRAAAAEQGRAEFLSLWAGQGVGLSRRQSATELIERLARETESAIDALASVQLSRPSDQNSNRGIEQ